MLPEPIHEPETRILSLHLSLMGRPVKNYYFDKPVITIGRDPGSDIFIDNAGVSREHVRLEQISPGEYEVVDLGSANGTVLNEMPVKCKIPLREGDHLRIGKHTLTVSYQDDRRSGSPGAMQPTPDVENKTVVLSRDEIHRLLDRQRKADTEPPPSPPAALADAMQAASAAGLSTAGGRQRSHWVLPAFIGFVIGAACGALAMWYFIR